MTLETALILAYAGLASVLVALMAVRRVFRSSPVFFAYVCFDLLATAADLAIFYCGVSSEGHLRYFLFTEVVDCLLYFRVLVELGKNLLRFNRKSRPLWKLAILLFAATAVLTGALSQWAATPNRTLLGNICFLGMRADGVLQFAGFLTLISWSSLRKLRWPERELRIATGFAFFAFVWFLTSLLQFQWYTGPVYYGLYWAGQAADVVTLGYWLHSFWIEEQGSPARNEDAERGGERGRDDAERTQCLDHA